MNKSLKTIIFSFVVNTGLTILKVIIGFIGNSSALIADGIHSLSDSITDIFSIVGIYISQKEADENHPYGYGMLEYIISLGISCVVIFIGLLLIETGFNQSYEIPKMIVLIVTLICILVKYALARYIYKVGKKQKNNILISGSVESKADVYSSIVVLISTVLMILSEKVEFFKYANKVAVILVGILIIRVGIKLLIENGNILVGHKVKDTRLNNKVYKEILEFENVIDVKSVYIFNNGEKFKLMVEIIMDEQLLLKDATVEVNRIKKILLEKHNFGYINIEIISFSK
ncbi:MAG: cation diffusion facilitator family transporter [Mycoplasmatota bacterium]